MSFQRFELKAFSERHDIADDQFDAAVALINPTRSGPWLVGGSVRRLISQAKQDSDFDVACSSATQLESVKALLLGAGFAKKRETDAHVELCGKLGNNPAQIVQLLKLSYPAELETVLDSFDFTICQFGYDGTDLVSGQFSLWDLSRKKLVLHKLTFGASTVRRLTKYAKQGYTFCQGTIVAILEAAVADPAKIQAEVAYVD